MCARNQVIRHLLNNSQVRLDLRFPRKPIHFAIWARNPPCLKPLITDARSTLAERGREDRTPLVEAICLGNVEAPTLLLDDSRTDIASRDAEGLTINFM
jgi:hypothetical protein